MCPYAQWPFSNNLPDVSKNICERKPINSNSLIVSRVIEESESLQQFFKLSSLQKTTAWCLSFINNCRNLLKHQSNFALGFVELQNALLYCAQEVGGRL